MFDIHCHILPGVDDGAGLYADSLDMFRVAEGGGTKEIICTPHCNIPASHHLNYRTAALAEHFKRIRAHLLNDNIGVGMHIGAEVFCTPDIIELFRSGRLITLCGSVNMLIEFDFGIRGSDAVEYVSALSAEGVVPVVAHPERYGFIKEDFGYADRLKAAGALLQVNKGSLLGELGHSAEEAAHYLVATRRADFAASDAHGPYRRSPSLAEVYEMISEVYSADYADFLLITNPLNIIRRKKAVSAV